jgi:hypothetical protein
MVIMRFLTALRFILNDGIHNSEKRRESKNGCSLSALSPSSPNNVAVIPNAEKNPLFLAGKPSFRLQEYPK